MPYNNVSITRVQSANANVIIGYEESNQGIGLSLVVDYSNVYDRIATALETIANQIILIANKQFKYNGEFGILYQYINGAY